MNHASPKAHIRITPIITSVIAGLGEDMESEIRGALHTRGVNPSIELGPQPNPPANSDGVVNPRRVSSSDPVNGGALSLIWYVQNFDFAPDQSKNTVTQYRNGLQRVSSDGKYSGHAHLHIALLSEWPAVVLATATGAPMPASYMFFGGHDWYWIHRVANGKTEVYMQHADMPANAFRKYVPIPGRLYLARFDLVQIDDEPVFGAKHGEPAGSLMTVFRVPV